jgi:hypothetical protein
MPAPSSYTEGALAEYLVDDLGDVASALGWTTDTIQVVRAIEDTLLDYGVDTIAEATNIRKLRALGKRALLRIAVKSLSARVDVAAQDQRLTLSQAYKQAKEELAVAETKAEVYDTESGGIVRVGAVVYEDDHYSPRYLSEQTGW